MTSSSCEREETRKIERPRLVAPLMQSLTSHRLTWLSAPAGFGKSVLLRQLAEEADRRMTTRWLSMGGGLGSSDRLESRVDQALGRLLSETKSGSRGAGDSAPAFALFIDGAGGLRTQAEFETLELLLSAMPAYGRLVVASKCEFPRHLMRHPEWYSRPVEATALCFSLEELRLLGEGSGTVSDSSTLFRLYRATDGWPAIVTLLLGQPGGSFDNLDTERALREYLEDDVMRGLPEDLRQFAMESSILEVLDARLCDRVRNAGDSEWAIRSLAEEFRLLLPLGSAEGRYRFPRPLMRFLREKLRRAAPARMADLHRAAVGEQLDREATEEALEHAFQVGNRGALVELLSEHADMLLARGRMRSLARWLDDLDAAGMLDDHPKLQLARAWALMFTRDRQTAGAIARTLRERGGNDALASQIAAVEATLLSMADKVEEAAIATHPPHGYDPDSAFASEIGVCTYALTQLLSGRLDSAEQTLTTIGNERRENTFARAYIEAITAMIALLRGDLPFARVHLERASQASALRLPVFGGNSQVATLTARLAYDRGEYADARRLIELHLPLLRHIGLPDQIIMAYVLLARMAFRRGDAEQSMRLLAELEILGGDQQMERLIASARLERVRIALLRGDVQQAQSELGAAGTPIWERIEKHAFIANDHDTYSLMCVRVALAAGETDGLAERLERDLGFAERHRRGRRALAIRVLLAQVLHATGHRHAAIRVMEAALREAAKQDLTSPFVDELPGAMLLVDQCDLQLASESDVLYGYLQRLHALVGDFRAGEAVTPAVLKVDDLLTKKEQQVLTLLAGGLSNEGIATRLFVSESTVRTHLRSVNAKLNAKSRLEALAIARSMGLLPP